MDEDFKREIAEISKADAILHAQAHLHVADANLSLAGLTLAKAGLCSVPPMINNVHKGIHNVLDALKEEARKSEDFLIKMLNKAAGMAEPSSNLHPEMSKILKSFGIDPNQMPPGNINN